MYKKLLMLLVCLLIPISAVAAEGETVAYRNAYELVLDEQWKEAVEAFTGFVNQYPDSSWADDAGFWKCYARERAGMDAKTTFECYLELQKQWPNSEWVDDAQRAAVALAREISRKGDNSYLDRVRGFQTDDDSQSILAVLAALADVGDQASVQAILDRLSQTKDARLRAEMVSILDGVESDAALTTIVDLARNDPSPKVRAVAIEVIADHSAAKHFDLLADLARNDVSAEVREAAVMAIADSEDRRGLAVLEEIARGQDPHAARAAVEAIGESGFPGATTALERLLKDTNLSDLRLDIAQAIAENDSPRALSILSGMAKSDDLEVAEDAIEAIGDLEIRGAVAALSEIADSASNRRLRIAAIEALSNGESQEALNAQLRLLRTADDPQIRTAAADALGWREDDRIIDPLAEAARLDPDSRVREAATHALGDIGSARARDALINLLKD